MSISVEEKVGLSEIINVVAIGRWYYAYDEKKPEFWGYRQGLSTTMKIDGEQSIYRYEPIPDESWAHSMNPDAITGSVYYDADLKKVVIEGPKDLRRYKDLLRRLMMQFSLNIVPKEYILFKTE